MKTVTCVLHHHIGDESLCEKGLGITTGFDTYVDHIEWLSRHYNFIGLDELLSGKLPPKPLLITFDDVFHSVLQVARDVLHPRGIPAVFFVNPGLLGSSAISIDRVLAWAFNSFGIEKVCEAIGVSRCNDLRELIGSEMSKLSSSERESVKQSVILKLGQPDATQKSRALELEDLRAFADIDIELGNHTMTHVHCRSLTKDELLTEIVAAKTKLEKLSGQTVRAFSVPYGHENDLTEDILVCLRESGHKAVFLVHAQANFWRQKKDVWYRTSLQNDATQSLALKIRYLPYVRTLRRVALPR